jgi:nucleoside 2-deoxyribosyltransferase
MEKLMNIYIASSLKNHIINLHIANTLSKEGINCFLPQAQTYNDPNKRNSNNYSSLATIVYSDNLSAIKGSDALLVVAHLIGTDTAWECGYALGINKPVFLLEYNNTNIQEMYMVYESIKEERRFRLNHLSDGSLKELAKAITNQ